MDKSEITSQQLEAKLNYLLEQQRTSHVLELFLSSQMQEDNQNAVRFIISYINRLLGAAITRHKGLTLLDKVILQCPSSVLMDNAVAWSNVCVNSSKGPVHTLRFKVLEKILQGCSGTPDFNKSVITSLPKIIDMCLSQNPDRVVTEGSLECLKTCLQKYSSTCGPFKNKVEVYLSKYFTCTQPASTVRKAGSAFHYLQQVGGSGAEGITHRTNWFNQLSKLCSTMHKLYHQFFERVTEFEHKDLDVPSFEVAHLNEHGSSVPYVAAGALRNVVIFIKCMLVEYFPTEKNVAVPHILGVIKRGLLVDAFVECNNSIEESQFVALLYTHQIDLLYLLQSLISCCKLTIMPASITISKLLTDCLQRTQKNYFRNSSDYKIAVLRVLQYWIAIAQNKVTSLLHNKLVSLVVSEITPAKSDVMLCLNENLMAKKGKGKKKILQATIPNTSESESGTQKSLKIKEIVCAEALNTGKSLLQHVILQLNQESYEILFHTIIQHLLNIQGGKIVHPYSNPKCQVQLYDMLAYILMQPTFCMSPLLQTAINVFTRGQTRSVNSTNDGIYLACAKGLDILEKLCQGTCPTLHINQVIGSDDLSKSRKRTHDMVESENVRVVDLDPSVVNEFSENMENQNDITRLTQISPPNNPLPNKVHIINVHIIKEAIDVVGSNDISMEEASASLEEQMDNAEDTGNLLENDLKSNLDKKEIIVQEKYQAELPEYNDDIEVKVCKSEVKEKETPTDKGITIADVRTLKQSLSTIDVDDQEAEMMNSFNDVLGQ